MQLSTKQLLWVNHFAKGLFLLCKRLDTVISFETYIVWAHSAVAQLYLILKKFKIHSILTPNIDVGSLGMSDYQLIKLLVLMILQTMKCINNLTTPVQCCQSWNIRSSFYVLPNKCNKMVDKNSTDWKLDRLGDLSWLLEFCSVDDIHAALKTSRELYYILNLMIKQQSNIDVVTDKIFNTMFPGIHISICDLDNTSRTESQYRKTFYASTSEILNSHMDISVTNANLDFIDAIRNIIAASDVKLSCDERKMIDVLLDKA